ncbi:MAG TPA: hypothetical protein VF665_05995 [Longimicrobium sp.]|jgi:hypothetical protein|uniref:hypothetical protein n=1 Tax=Longimicrobium sp. TaxID=2029185 RepID=UPI002ED7ABE5
MSSADSQDRPDPEYVQRNPPSPSRKRKEKDGYVADFYPGFVRRLAVRRAGQEVVVYEQAPDDPFILPAGSDKPWDTSEIVVQGGPSARDVRLVVHDPHQEIDSIVIRLRGRSPRLAGGGEDEEIEVLDGTVLCPPMCPPIIPVGGGG